MYLGSDIYKIDKVFLNDCKNVIQNLKPVFNAVVKNVIQRKEIENVKTWILCFFGN